MEQPDINQLVKECSDKGISDEKIIGMLCSIIKQQMLYGGSLMDKVSFCLYELKRPLKS
jgi:hypothetical protein